MGAFAWIRQLVSLQADNSSQFQRWDRESLAPQLQVKRLEERRVLNADAAPVEALLVIDAGSAAADGQADTYVVEQHEDHVHITVNGQEVSRTPISQFGAIHIHGSNDDDILIAEFKSGEPLAGLDLLFDGGGGNDTLTLNGDMSAQEVTHEFGDTDLNHIGIESSSGTATIAHIGVEAVQDNLTAENRTFRFESDGEQILLSDFGSSHDDLSRILTTDATEHSELSVVFKNPTNSLGIETNTSVESSDSVELTGLDGNFDADLLVVGSPEDLLVVQGAMDFGSGNVEVVTGTIRIEDSLTSEDATFSFQAQHELIVGQDGVISNERGTVDLEAPSIVHDGIIAAQGGETRLDSGDGGVTVVRGVIDVSNAAAVELGGTVQVLGAQVALLDGARIDASGAGGGGKVLVGGDYQGSNAAIRNARQAYLGSDAVISANATVAGMGGTVIVWANEMAAVYGTILARGGALGGDGGFVETSGKQYLDFQGSVDASAAHGAAGTWLLDPEDVTIAAAANVNVTPVLVGIELSFTFNAQDVASTINTAGIVAALNLGNNVTITTDGTITVSAAIAKTADAGGDGSLLTLEAVGTITVNALSTISSVAGPLHIVFDSDAGIVINSAITTNGGSFTSTGTTFTNTLGTITTGGGAVSIVHSGLVTVDAAINAGTGIIGISGSSVTQNANITTAGTGTVNVRATSGDITMAAGTTTTTAIGSIVYRAGDNVNVRLLTSTSGAVNITADTGAINESINNGADKIDTTGPVMLIGATGIGNLSELNLGNVSNLTLDTDGSFDVSTDVEITDLTITVNPAGGPHTYLLDDAGSNLAFTVTDGGADLTVTEVSVDDGNNLNFSLTTDTGNIGLDVVDVNAGNVSITATAGSINDDNAATNNIMASNLSLAANAAGQSIGAAADPLDVTLSGALTAGANSGVGGIHIREFGNMLVASINAGAGNVNLVATNGSLTSQNVNGVADVVGATIDLSVTGAGSDIGTSAALPLEINATTLLNASTAGAAGDNIFIRDTAGGLVVGLVNAGAGNVDLEVLGGSLTSQNVNGAADVVGATIDLSVTGAGSDIGTSAALPLEINATTLLNASTAGAAGDNIFIRDTAGGLVVGLVNAGAGNVDLEVLGGSLTSQNVNGAADVVGATIDLSVTGAGSDIGTSAALPLEINATTLLNASTAGAAGDNIFIRDTAGGLVVGLVNAGAGNVDLEVLGGSLTSQNVNGAADVVGATIDLSVTGAGSDIGTSAALPLEINATTLLNASTAGAAGDNIFIRDTAGGLVVGLVNAGAGNVDLEVLGGSLTSQNVNGAADVVGATIDLSVTGAGSDIGTSAALPLEINATTLLNASTAGAAGDNIFIRDTAGGLVVGLVNAGAGNVDLEVLGGSLTSQNVNGAADVVGATIDLSVTGAGSDIGTSAALPLEINATTLLNASTAGAAGDNIFIRDTAGGLVVGLVNAGAGNVDLEVLGGSLTSQNVNGAADVVGATIDLSVTGAGSDIGTSAALPLEINATTLLNASTAGAAGDNIFIDDVVGALPLGLVSAGLGDAQLRAPNGSITDGNGTANNVTAANVSLLANVSIGTITNFDVADFVTPFDPSPDSNGAGNGIEISVSAIAMASANTIHLLQDGSLNLTAGAIDITGVGQAIINASGDLNAGAANVFTLINDSLALLSGATLTIPVAGFNAGTGDLRMVGEADVLDTDHTLAFAADDLFFRSGGGMLGDNVTLLTGVNSLTAQLDLNNFTVSETNAIKLTSVITDVGSISVTTIAGAIEVGLVQAALGAQDTTLNSAAAITELGPSDANADVVGNSINLVAVSGIGTNAIHLDVTATTALSATTTAANSSIFIDSIGNLPVELVDAGVILGVATGDVTLNSTGNINNRFAPDGTANVVGKTLNLMSAAGGIGTTISLEVTAATALHANTSGATPNILINSIGNLPVGLVNAGGGAGDVTFTSTGNINNDAAPDGVANLIGDDLDLVAAVGGVGNTFVLEVTAGGVLDADSAADNFNIFINSIGNLRLGLVNAGMSVVLGMSNVTLDSTGNIADDAVIDDSTTDVVATNLILTAALGVGTSGNSIDTSVAKFEGDGKGGGLFITDQDSLEIGGIGALTGASAAGTVDIRTAAENLQILEEVKSTAQSVNLSGAGTLAINADVSALVGNVGLRAGAGGVTSLTMMAGTLVRAIGGQIGPATFANDGTRFTLLDNINTRVLVPGPGNGLTLSEPTATIQVFAADVNGTNITNSNYDIVIDWTSVLGLPAPPPDIVGAPVPNNDPDFNLAARFVGSEMNGLAVNPADIITFTFQHEYSENPNQNDAQDIDVRVHIERIAGGTIQVTLGSLPLVAPININQVGISEPLIIPVLDLPTVVPVLPAQSLPANPPAPPVVADNAEVVAAPPQRVTIQFVASSAGVTSAGEERYYELRVVSFGEDGELEEKEEAKVRLDDPKLKAIFPFDPSKLPALFGRLPADRYRIYLIEDGTERLILEFTIEQGQPIEIPEVNDVEPVGEGVADPFMDDAAGIHIFNGGQLVGVDKSIPDVATTAIEAYMTPNDAPQSNRSQSESRKSRHESRSAESFAERLGNTSFISHGGVVVCAAAVAYAGSEPWEKSINRLMERFDRRRRLPEWRRRTQSESRTSDAAAHDSVPLLS